MIRAYTNNSGHAEALRLAAIINKIELAVEVQLHPGSLSAQLDDTTMVVIDLTEAGGTARRIIQQLDSLGSDDLPPVLWLLRSTADVPMLGEADHIVNQDFTIAPITVDALAQRLQVLRLLGSRRRMALESAIIDKLTGLYNRKYFLRRLEEEMYRAERYKYNVGCILADVDFSADAELSESAGSSAVKEIGAFLTDRLRRTDVIARFRFSQFGVLLPDIPAEDSIAVARDLKLKLDTLSVADGGNAVALRAAVGHLLFPVEGKRTALQVVDALEDLCLRSKGADDIADYRS
ncbi:MAG: diguanylate cyclase [bacterium]|nr:diguanylate cyclase [bacterium]